MIQNNQNQVIETILKQRKWYLLSVAIMIPIFIGVVVLGLASEQVVKAGFAIAILVIFLQVPVFYKKCPNCGKFFFIKKFVTKPFTNKCVNCGIK